MVRSLVDLRSIVVAALGGVYRNEGTLEQVLFAEFAKRSKNTPTEFERNWCFEVLSGVLRHKGRVDYIIDTYSLKKKPTGGVRRALQVAVYQLIEQDAPQALVVSETISHIQKKEGKAPSQFANAILRKVSGSVPEWKKWCADSSVLNSKDAAEALAWSCLPEWWFNLLKKERTPEWLQGYIQGSLNRPKTWWFNAKTFEPVLQTQSLERPEHGFVQDLSNQELCKVVYECLVQHGYAGSEVLDLCAAPGGKSMNLAARGISVVATDESETRMQRLVENRSRLGMIEKIQITPFHEIWDGSKLWDAIWLDVPCTSSGVIRRHPEMKWNRGPQHLQEMILEQKKITDWAIERVKVGGLLVYSTCSVFKKENAPVLPLGWEVLFKFERGLDSPSAQDGIQATVFIKK